MIIDKQKKSVVIESEDLTVPDYEDITVTFNDEQYKALAIKAKKQNITITQLLEDVLNLLLTKE